MTKAKIAFAIGLILAPLPALAKAPEQANVERIAPERVRVSWLPSNSVDVYMAASPDASIEASRLVSGNDLDGVHEEAVSAGKRPYFLLRDRKAGTNLRVSERLVPLQQGSNFRDIGGYPAADGKHVRWGIIYRSGGTPLLTEADLDVVSQLRLANLVDLRSSEERQLAPTRIENVPYHAVGYSMDVIIKGMRAPSAGASTMPVNGGNLYRQMPRLLAPQVKLLFNRLLANEGAVAFNCSAGQDRTGFATAMVLAALGVSRDVIIEDFHLSTKYRRPEFEMARFDPAAFPDNAAAKLFTGHQNKDGIPRKPQPLKAADGTAFLSFALDEIDQRYGSVEAYLDSEVGVKREDIAKLRATYLE